MLAIKFSKFFFLTLLVTSCSIDEIERDSGSKGELVRIMFKIGVTSCTLPSKGIEILVSEKEAKLLNDVSLNNMLTIDSTNSFVSHLPGYVYVLNSKNESIALFDLDCNQVAGYPIDKNIEKKIIPYMKDYIRKIEICKAISSESKSRELPPPVIDINQSSFQKATNIDPKMIVKIVSENQSEPSKSNLRANSKEDAGVPK